MRKKIKLVKTMKSLAKTYCENDKQNSNNNSIKVRSNKPNNYRQLEKTIKERCRRDKINGCIIELKNIIKDSANLVSNRVCCKSK